MDAKGYINQSFSLIDTYRPYIGEFGVTYLLHWLDPIGQFLAAG
jgi:hypothetical protein